jgi:signal transduction histidine kinase
VVSLVELARKPRSVGGLEELDRVGGAHRREPTGLDRLHASLTGVVPATMQAVLAAARARAAAIAASGGESEASDAIAAAVYGADVVAGLAAEGGLRPDDPGLVARALAETCSLPLPAVTFDLFLRAVSSPTLFALPPAVAAEIQLRLLVHLDVASSVSLWRRTNEGDVECILAVGVDPDDRQAQLEARAVILGRRSRLEAVGRPGLRSAAVRRLDVTTAAVVARPNGLAGCDTTAYLEEAARALAPVLDRELLLERGAHCVEALTREAENRFTRIGFDLHDGPIQDVLSLGAETRRLSDDAAPFVLESHRELVSGRFDDLLGRVVEIDRQLRETAHSLESSSIVSRPLAEILHREVEGFGRRSGVAASIEVSGDPETLSPSQRVAIFRAIQEGLSNVREHSGASAVAVELRVRRTTVDVRVIDDGQGFEVGRALAQAAERGRLGLVGVAERMRMLGGSFTIDSRPGGPTTLRFSLPRWEPFEAVPRARR